MIQRPADKREELEDAWREKLERAQERYAAATHEFRSVQEETKQGLRPQGALERAREAESGALAEYSRVLRVFTNLTVRGQVPEDRQQPHLIAVVDDDESVRDSFRALLRSAGYRVAAFPSAELFLESDAPALAACLILDVRMPGIDGPELQFRLNSAGSRLPVIFVTAHDDGPVRHRVMQAGAVDVVHKPFQAAELLAILDAALKAQD